MFSVQHQFKDQLKNIAQYENKIAILGCGWLGLPLAEYCKVKGYEVNGSTTTSEKLKVLEEKGLKPFLLKLDPETNDEAFLDFLKVKYLVINIPPSLRKNSPGYHIRQVKFICSQLQELPKKVIFISSTSVYPENETEVNEEGAVNLNHELLQAEDILKQKLKNKLVILRCGGLMGYERIPGKYFAGKKGVPGGNNPVNYVHRDDVIRIIFQMLENEIFGGLFNVVAPHHPLKKEVCMKTAEDFGFEIPEFNEEKAAGFKIVNGEKLIKTLNFKFKYPDPVSFYYNFP